jgi:hypothetical protein
MTRPDPLRSTGTDAASALRNENINGDVSHPRARVDQHRVQTGGIGMGGGGRYTRNYDSIFGRPRPSSSPPAASNDAACKSKEGRGTAEEEAGSMGYMRDPRNGTEKDGDE